ncbi:MAG: class I SAM-dependent methyltransferase [Myxococcota bacterium]|nr:class I SAM-dependent methyltransferase [Myxococcota bacterium]
MRALDRWLQRWRIAKATPFIRDGDRVLDVGCFDATLLAGVSARIASGVGIDPEAEPRREANYALERSSLETAALEPRSFDALTMLAVLEHVPSPAETARRCFELLAPGGRAILTVPHPLVDRILDVLMALRLLDGMETEAHHGYDPAETRPVFEAAGFRLAREQRFQLGLNRLYVFEKPTASS